MVCTFSSFVLDLSVIEMKNALAIITLLWLLAGNFKASFIDRPQIDSPQSGQALQGVVVVTGSTDVRNFSSSEVAFSYSGDPSATWFLLQQSKEPVSEDTLAYWDTTTIADGEYSLRVRVTLTSGRSVESIVEGLRVRNYSPIETQTPNPVGVTNQLPTIPVSTSTLSSLMTPTSLPGNPAELRITSVSNSIQLGLIFVGVIFGGLLIYWVITRFTRK